MNNRMKLKKEYIEIISYLFWGVMTTVVSWASYGLFALMFSNQMDEVVLFSITIPMVVLLANILSWICAIIFAFVVNKLWVFQSKSWKKAVWVPELGKFLSSRIVTGIIEIVAVPLMVSLGLNQTILGVEGMFAKVLVSVIVVLLNYIFSKLFVFK